MKKKLFEIFALVLVMVCFVLVGCVIDENTDPEKSSERLESSPETDEKTVESNAETDEKKTETSEVSSEVISEESEESDPESEYEAGFEMLRYNWDGYGISQKGIYTCDLGYDIIDCLRNLQETGNVVPKISDDVVNEFSGELPIQRGTLWIDCGSVGLFRLNPAMTEICKVQTHLGEGRSLQMTDTLKELLAQAWYYYPFDCWSGTYENGTVSLEHVYKSDSAVESVEIESIHIENTHHSDNNRIVLSFRAKEDKTVTVDLGSYQSNDNLGSFDSKKIDLRKGEEVTVEFVFFGFYNYTYFVSITVDNTSIELTVDPSDDN